MAAETAAAPLRDLTDEELLTRLREAKEELFNLRFQVATGQLDNNRRLYTVRKDIARIYTVMRERELGIQRAGVDDTETTRETDTADEATTESRNADVTA
jgi:large subunit ribosomal protein L29